MFETAELGRTVSKDEFKEREPVLREQLLEAQAALRDANFPVLVVFAGVDGAGKGDTANLLNEWMDPRGLETCAYDAPYPGESERPKYWRYWRDLPPRGRIGIFLSAWYHLPLMESAYGRIDDAELDNRLNDARSFERTLAADGALILKFWMHLGKDAQQQRLKTLEKDPLHSWQVTEQDWDHWRIYDQFIGAAEKLILRTNTGDAPWTIVEGADPRFRSLKVGTTLLDAINRRLKEEEVAQTVTENSNSVEQDAAPAPITEPTTVLSRLDLTQRLEKSDYHDQRKKLQAKLNLLHRRAREKDLSMILVFEGWDAAGKGGAIRRITPALEARATKVVSIAAPSDEERSHHYLWRFWRHLPRAGHVKIFDRSWYGRVLVERVEGLADYKTWRRAYSEINDFERLLIRHGVVLQKFWIHISKEEQEKRFEARKAVPYKRWKLTAEDWRNRDRWHDYEIAVNSMVEQTSTHIAPWVLVEGEDKRYARIKILRSVCDGLEKALELADR